MSRFAVWTCEILVYNIIILKKITGKHMIFEVFMVLVIWILVLCVITPCNKAHWLKGQNKCLFIFCLLSIEPTFIDIPDPTLMTSSCQISSYVVVDWAEVT
jgi:hypothetical protein